MPKERLLGCSVVLVVKRRQLVSLCVVSIRRQDLKTHQLLFTPNTLSRNVGNKPT